MRYRVLTYVVKRILVISTYLLAWSCSIPWFTLWPDTSGYALCSDISRTSWIISTCCRFNSPFSFTYCLEACILICHYRIITFHSPHCKSISFASTRYHNLLDVRLSIYAVKTTVNCWTESNNKTVWSVIITFCHLWTKMFINTSANNLATYKSA